MLLAAIILASTLPAGATFPGKNGRLAFAVPSGGDQIVSVKPNGNGLNELTKGSKGSSRDPSYSADGEQIVFVSNRDGESDDIYVMEADGENVTRITDTPNRDEETPAFTGDGGTIVFSADGVIFSVAAVDGSGEERITKGIQPAVSPNGKTLAYVKKDDIFTSKIDGSLSTNLTKQWRQGRDRRVGFLAPGFSPDGKWIVLNSNLTAPKNDEFNDDLYVMKSNGNQFTRLTGNGIEEIGGAFSPKGDEIAYLGDTERGERKDGIYVIDVDGSGDHLVYKAKRPGPPTWQPLP